ncbi:MAG TPA: DUF6587 family protein [Burkholderiales bacterium]|nr:DUF6587 family protein [Burkholderiales bacterium]
MSSYALLETVIVGVIGLISAWQVMKILMPRTTQGLRTSIATRLNLVQGERHLPATGPSEAGSSGCGVGCGSACNGCGVAARIIQPLADQHKPSH